MADFEEALRWQLQNGGYTFGTRVLSAYSVQRPTVPYLVFVDVSQRPVHGQQGACDQIDRTYQLTVFDTSQSSVIATATKLRQTLDGFRGLFGPPGGQQWVVGACFYMGQHYAYDEDPLLHYIAVDFRLKFTDQ